MLYYLAESPKQTKTLKTKTSFSSEGGERDETLTRVKLVQASNNYDCNHSRNAMHYSFNAIRNPLREARVYLILQTRKLRHREDMSGSREES